MIAYRIHLLRTGRTSAKGDGQYVGQQDIPLCEQGRQELRALRRQFVYPPAEMVFTSPLLRCTETAEILYPERYTEQLFGLADMALGRFEGNTFEQLRGDPAFAAWLQNSAENAPPGGEDAEAFTRRIVDAVRQIFRRMMEEQMTNVAVVTHGGVIMSLLAAIGLPKLPLPRWAVANGAGYTLLLTPQMWMRDGCVEVFAPIPEQAETGGQDTHDR